MGFNPVQTTHTTAVLEFHDNTGRGNGCSVVANTNGRFRLKRDHIEVLDAIPTRLEAT